MASAFFYGTLMHPVILKRVIGHDGYQLQIRPAVLLDYTRHKVKVEANYPGIVPYAQSRDMFSEDLTLEERSVRGSLVTGLSERDMRRLDAFEGDEYILEQVLVYPLGPPVALDDIEPMDNDPPPPFSPDELTNPLEVNTYVWCSELSRLHPTLWSFEEFLRENAQKWLERDEYY